MSVVTTITSIVADDHTPVEADDFDAMFDAPVCDECETICWKLDGWLSTDDELLCPTCAARQAQWHHWLELAKQHPMGSDARAHCLHMAEVYG